MTDFIPVGEPDGFRFVGLLGVLERVTEMTRLTMEQLAKYGWSDEVSRTIGPAWEDQRQQASRLGEAVRSGFFDAALIAHGLSDEHPSWEFKRAVFEAAVAAVPELPDDSDDEQSRLRKLKNWFRGAKDGLSAGDVILKSLSSAIPIVGPAYPETKEAAEIAAGIAGRDDTEPQGKPNDDPFEDPLPLRDDGDPEVLDLDDIDLSDDDFQNFELPDDFGDER